eukprot:5772940-Prymnesium_polylepis.1
MYHVRSKTVSATRNAIPTTKPLTAGAIKRRRARGIMGTSRTGARQSQWRLRRSPRPSVDWEAEPQPQ